MAELPEPESSSHSSRLLVALRWSKLEWHVAAPCEPDVDFLVPKSSLKLAPETPKEVFEALSKQALKSEGLEEREAGVWCLFCPTAIPY